MSEDLMVRIDRDQGFTSHRLRRKEMVTSDAHLLPRIRQVGTVVMLSAFTNHGFLDG